MAVHCMTNLLFQHTAARRRLALSKPDIITIANVSTHSRPKAAGPPLPIVRRNIRVSTHSRPKAAGLGLAVNGTGGEVSTHSRPKAAGNVEGR